MYILLAILIFGLLVFVHELGHFVVARLCGVKVLEFAIGMGPKLFSIKSKKSGTAYSIRLIPIGGFVSMLGESGMEAVQGSSDDPSEKKDAEDNQSFFINDTAKAAEPEKLPSRDPEVEAELAKHAYCNQSVWKRILISLAGPMMNLLLGFLLMMVVILAAGHSTIGSNQIAAFYVEYSAEEAQQGFLQGDNIAAVNGKEIRSMAQFKAAVEASGGAPISVTVDRLNAEKTEIISVTLENVVLTQEQIDGLFECSRSERAGLQINDVVIKVNRTSVHTADELRYEVVNQGYAPINLTVLRNGERVELKDVSFPTAQEQGIFLGIPDFIVYREAKFDFATVMKHTFWRSYSTVKMVFDSLGGLFSGRYGMQAVSGPIGITQMIGEVAKTGWINVVNMIVMISINLGIMNLLPIPALDGGHLLIYAVEVVRRKPLKPEVEGIINFVGLVLMLGLAVLIAIKDVIAL